MKKHLSKNGIANCLQKLKLKSVHSLSLFMNVKIHFLAASAIACLTSGCIMPSPYPYYEGPVEYGRPVYGAPRPAEAIYVPDVIIEEGGVRHDRYFYQRHPEFYRRDQMRYPERFSHRPPSRYEDPRAKKKKHDDKDHDERNR